MMSLPAPVFVDTYKANYAPRTAVLPGVSDPITTDEHKYFFVFIQDIGPTNVSSGPLHAMYTALSVRKTIGLN